MICFRHHERPGEQSHLCCAVVSRGQTISAEADRSRIAALREVINITEPSLVFLPEYVLISDHSIGVQELPSCSYSDHILFCEDRVRLQKGHNPKGIPFDEWQLVQGASVPIFRLLWNIFQTSNLPVDDCS
jgi:hypothetical protein